jgi:tRNA dimethylallyltransferase
VCSDAAACAPRAPAILLMGPTGAGKTELAVALAERLPLGIVSVDSAMIYRGMDIGTAKPPPDVLARAPHRLIDMLPPTASYSAGRFLRDALREMDDIERTGRVPLLVGGTMMYFRVLQRGLAELPEGDASVRAGLDARAARDGWPALHAELARIDAPSARRIHPHDAQRIQRALEVYALRGEPLSALQASAQAPSRRWLKLALAPRERDTLHARIARRLDAMLAAGFVREVQELHARGDLDERSTSVRAVGYRQLWEHVCGRVGLDSAVARAAAATRQLAKRQLTWLRAESDVRWLDSDDAGRYTRALEQVEAAITGGIPPVRQADR